MIILFYSQMIQYWIGLEFEIFKQDIYLNFLIYEVNEVINFFSFCIKKLLGLISQMIDLKNYIDFGV